jgi:DIS3-like exonuclease 2
MLLANIAVAQKIYSKFPEKSILRRHPEPNVKQIDDLSETLQSYGFNVDTKSSNTIQEFLISVQNDDPLAYVTLTQLLTKTMQLAQYFCSTPHLDQSYYRHYGLAVPMYTHFTSPIRRYPDILVHRLLGACLDYNPEIEWSTKILQKIADTCNEKKYSAKTCSERSCEMFFGLFINECGKLEESASVVQIKDHSFDVLIMNYGLVKRIYCEVNQLEV